MTPRQLLWTLRRRWYVLLAVLCLTAVVGMLLPRQPGVWYTRVDVVFLTPNNPTRVGNALEGQDESLIDFTAAVQRQVNGSSQPIQLSSPEATLYGAGVRHGYIVTLPNEGGQWTPSFSQSILRVEVVDGTEQQTEAVAMDVIGQIEQASQTTQDLLDVPNAMRIRTEVNPNRPAVGFVGGSNKRALAVLGLLGSGLAIAVAIMVDGAVARRRRSSHPVKPAGSLAARPA